SFAKQPRRLTRSSSSNSADVPAFSGGRAEYATADLTRERFHAPDRRCAMASVAREYSCKPSSERVVNLRQGQTVIFDPGEGFTEIPSHALGQGIDAIKELFFACKLLAFDKQ